MKANAASIVVKNGSGQQMIDINDHGPKENQKHPQPFVPCIKEHDDKGH